MGSVVRLSSWQSLAIFSPALTAKGAVRRRELGWLFDCPTLRDFTTQQITPKCANSATRWHYCDLTSIHCGDRQTVTKNATQPNRSLHRKERLLAISRCARRR